MSDIPTLRELARDDPEAVRSVARKSDDELRAWLEQVLADAED